jgi:hypothetical protein
MTVGILLRQRPCEEERFRWEPSGQSAGPVRPPHCGRRSRGRELPAPARPVRPQVPPRSPCAGTVPAARRQGRRGPRAGSSCSRSPAPAPDPLLGRPVLRCRERWLRVFAPARTRPRCPAPPSAPPQVRRPRRGRGAARRGTRAVRSRLQRLGDCQCLLDERDWQARGERRQHVTPARCPAELLGRTDGVTEQFLWKQRSERHPGQSLLNPL